MQNSPNQPIPFKAETRQLLNILIHSLYSEREIFLRELISNASDALTRLNFEMLTNHNILDPDAPLEIRIFPDPEKCTLTIIDNGIGMTRDEISENLGTIAHSGAREFLQNMQTAKVNLDNIIGQFGVGFYSAFMVADSIEVNSRSIHQDAQAVSWTSTGDDTYTISESDKASRGTMVILHLREDAAEFAQEPRLRQIIRRHSDYIPFPIFIGDNPEQINRQTALWRQTPRQTNEEEINSFYKQFTLDHEAPLAYAHMYVDAPVQIFALLFIPHSKDKGMFSLRREPGLKLFSRKVLIQEYSKDLLPEYLDFVQGVVDSEDLPLNVSRETFQVNRVLAQLKKVITNKIIDTLKSLGKEHPEKYVHFWQNYAYAIKQGIATDPTEPENLFSLLRFHSNTHPDEWFSLDDYLERKKPEQDKIYYILGDDERSLQFSPHLDPYKQQGIEVLFLTDPLDSFVLLRLTHYHAHDLRNVAIEEAPLSNPPEQDTSGQPFDQNQSDQLVSLFKRILEEKVAQVRISDRLLDSPARLVDPEGAEDQSMQRVYRILNKDYEIPKKVLEINPRHPILQRLIQLPPEDDRCTWAILQIYENALLLEGLHPNPASMVNRIQQIITSALQHD